MGRPGKTQYLALILGRRSRGDRRAWQCVFPKLEAAQQWCVKHADDRGCSAEVVLGSTGGGRVLWRYKGVAHKRAD